MSYVKKLSKCPTYLKNLFLYILVYGSGEIV